MINKKIVSSLTLTLVIASSCNFFNKKSQEDQIPIALDFEADQNIENLAELNSILIEDEVQGIASSEIFLNSFYEERLKSIEESKSFKPFSISVELDSLRKTDFFESKKYINQNRIAIRYSEQLKVLTRFTTLTELTESQIKLFDLHEKLLTNALFLTDRKQHDLNNQNGLAYTWGSKDHTKAYKPYNYDEKPNICQENLYGLDCSGMIYQLMLNSGVNFGIKPRKFANASFFSKPKNWVKPSHKQSEVFPLPNYFGCEDCFEVITIESPKLEEIMSGDIIYFWNKNKKVNHIGICLKHSGLGKETSLVIFESRGRPSKDCPYNKSRGPQRSITISKRLRNYKEFGIIRIVAN